MTIEIDLDGSRRQVTLRRDGPSTREGSLGTGDQWRVAIDGREVAVSVVEAAGRWSVLVGPPAFLTAGASAKAVSRKTYDIAFEPGPGGGLLVHVNGVVVPLSVLDQPGTASVARRRGRDTDTHADTDLRAIVAPMPGRIVKVLVQPGEAVQPRQGLVVIEAMKMENELRAPRGGTVAEIRVTAGTSVEANAVLVVLR